MLKSQLFSYNRSYRSSFWYSIPERQAERSFMKIFLSTSPIFQARIRRNLKFVSEFKILQFSGELRIQYKGSGDATCNLMLPI